jgi:alkylhydroperoxidase family enzyme
MTSPPNPPVSSPYAPVVARRRSAEIVAIAKQKTGMTISAYDYLSPVPWVVEGYIDFMRYMNAPYVLSTHQSKLCTLVVSHDHSCRYCHGASRALLRISGMREEQIRRLEQDLHGADLSQAEKQLLDVALKVSRGNVSAGDVAALRAAGFSESAILELAFLVAGAGCYTFRLATPLSLPVDDAVVKMQHPLALAVRPVVSLGIHWMTTSKRQAPVPFPAANDGPFSWLVEGYRTLPNAAVLLRTLIDRAFASPILSKRVKGLMIAVIARTMGAEAVEAEAEALLLQEGMTPADIARAIGFLSCPTLSPQENRLLTFARDTVKYVPTALQDRTRALKDGLTDEELIEVLGVCGLANALARLSLLLRQV